MVFIMGAGGILVAAIADKLTEDYGRPAIGKILRGSLAIAGAGLIVWFLTSGAVAVFL